MGVARIFAGGSLYCLGCTGYFRERLMTLTFSKMLTSFITHRNSHSMKYALN